MSIADDRAGAEGMSSNPDGTQPMLDAVLRVTLQGKPHKVTAIRRWSAEYPSPVTVRL